MKFMDEFGEFLRGTATFNLNVNGVIRFTNLLNRYNALREKVRENIFEIRGLKEDMKPEGKPEKPKK